MSIQHTGAVVSRAGGVVLLVIACSSLLSWPMFEPSGFGTAGWTSYSPLATNTVPDLMTQLHDTYFVAGTPPSFWLPSSVQGFAGLVMIVFGRTIGRWLARGLSAEDTH